MSYELITIVSQDEWKSFCSDRGQNALFQSWLWGDVQQKLGIPVWRLGIYEDKKLFGLAQVFKITARRGSFLHIRHGPMLPTSFIDHWKWFIHEMKIRAKAEGVWFVRLNPLIENSPDNQALFRMLGLIPSAIHAMDAEYTWVLDLDKNEEELLAGMRKTTRYEIRRAISTGVEVEISNDSVKLKDFFFLYGETMKRQDFIPNRGIREEFEAFVKKGQALLLLGKYNKQVTTAAIVLFSGNQAIYHYGASIPSEVGVSYLVQWESIREAKKRGCSVYNFWGIAPDDKPKHPWRGITLFKKGFGGRPAEYIHAHDLPISPFYFLSRTVESIRRIRKGY